MTLLCLESLLEQQVVCFNLLLFFSETDRAGWSVSTCSAPAITCRECKCALHLQGYVH